MTLRKRRSEHDPLFGMPTLRPEWLAQRDDAREREAEKTRLLRAARLAAKVPVVPVAEARPSVTASKKEARAPLRERRRIASAASD